MEEDYKTLQRLKKALSATNGAHDTIAVVYCSNDDRAYASAFVGETSVLVSALCTLFNKIGTRTAMPQETAIAGGILRAIAASDILHNGDLVAAIESYKKELINIQHPKNHEVFS